MAMTGAHFLRRRKPLRVRWLRANSASSMKGFSVFLRVKAVLLQGSEPRFVFYTRTDIIK